MKWKLIHLHTLGLHTYSLADLYAWIMLLRFEANHGFILLGLFVETLKGEFTNFDNVILNDAPR